MKTYYVAKYIGLGVRVCNAEEIEVRRVAQFLKHGEARAIAAAAAQMAALIDGPCWLVPVPSSKGGLTANNELACAIAKLVPGARVKQAVKRTQPVESSCYLRLHGHAGLSPKQHHIIRAAGPMDPLPIYFVDNVITTGSTLQACHDAMGWGDGLAYADASTRTTARPVKAQPELALF